MHTVSYLTKLFVSRNSLLLCAAINCAIKVVYGPIYFQYFLLDVAESCRK
jgi:hypothetical protein